MPILRDKRFLVGCILGAFFAAILNILPFVLSRGAYNSDGYEVVGFPFEFRRLGGFAGIYQFHLWALAIDILIAAGIAVAAGYLCANLPFRKLVHAVPLEAETRGEKNL